VKEREVFAIFQGCLHYGNEIVSNPNLPARKVNPVKAIRISKEGGYFFGGKLIFRAFFPDVARFAFVIAPIGKDERQFVWKWQPPEV